MVIRKLLYFYLFYGFLLLANISDAMAQCGARRSQIDITFDTNQDCAPTTVTQFTITYYFNTPQDPADIAILFEWNNPNDDISYVNSNSGLIAAENNTKFTATGTFTYPVDENCSFNPTSYIVFQNEVCNTSAQEQTAYSWARDNEFGGIVAIGPKNYDVCYGDPVVDAVFADNSFFNCNINVEPDNPNQQMRHVQFVYGTNHNEAQTIRDLSLNDGATQNLTDGNGSLVTTETRGTGLQVTGAYFGPVDVIEFPADAPTSKTFPLNAPANPENAIDNVFEITMYNWNLCNPFNGDNANPNYGDAIATTAYIRIIDDPLPDFITKKDNVNGEITTEFCIGEAIYFDNQSLNADDYQWEFFDDNSGANLLKTATSHNPTFSYSTSGEKLIRLTAINRAAQGQCLETKEVVINIAPSMLARINTTDKDGNLIDPVFCQDETNPTSFHVRFVDASKGTTTANTRWRWEFYDENHQLIREEPGAGTFSSSPLGPFDLSYTASGIHTARLHIKDDVTGCQSIAEVEVVLYNSPQSDFNARQVCEGSETYFEDISSIAAVDGEQIVLWEWDFNYDGTTFTKDAAFDNKRQFSKNMGPAGVYNVALSVTTDRNSCSDIIVKEVVVDSTPVANITADKTSGCGELTVRFTNEGAASDKEMISQYTWEIDDGGGFKVDSIQDPSDPNFSAVYSRVFENYSSSDKSFQVRLKSLSKNGCETISSPITVSMTPGPTAGFMSANYSPFDNNCSPVEVLFQVDKNTQSLEPSDYEWLVEDVYGVVHQESTGTTPAFDYNFINNTQSIKNFYVTLKTTLSSGCSGDSTRTIRINPVPPAEFTIDTLLLDCDIMRINFDADQKGLSGYYWEIRENGELTFASDSHGDNFTYTFDKNNEAKAVDVTLQTTNFANCKSEVVAQNFTVPVKEEMNVAFTATPHDQTLPDATVFLNNTTNEGPWKYNWDFGDGQTSSDPDIKSHKYETYGIYTIKLTVSYQGCIETRAITIKIRPIPPVVDFSYDPASGCAPLTVSFTNLTKYAEANSYVWNFGDNQGSSKVEHPTFTYYEPGVYSVTLSATNAMGDTIRETKPLIIEVYAQPNAEFDVRPNVVHVPDDILYTDNNSIGASYFHWDFGDGTTSLKQQPVHTYAEEGRYDITLVATSSYGCTDSTTRVGVVQAVTGGNILVPNAFSPNLSGPIGGGSGGLVGTNDIFLPITKGVADFEMLIYNRWGELLFQSTDKNSGWDGYYNGKLCPQDVYVYKLNLTYKDGRTATRMGDVNLIR